MKKKVIRLNENDLRKLVKRSVGRILKEESFQDLDLDDEGYDEDFEDYDDFDGVEEIYDTDEFDDVDEFDDEDGLDLNFPETDDDLGLTPYDYDDEEDEDDYFAKKYSRASEKYPRVRKMR